MAPAKPRQPAASNTSLLQKKTVGPRSPQENEAGRPETLGRHVKASAAKSKNPSLRPAPKTTTPPETIRKHPASTKRGEASISSVVPLQLVGPSSSAKATLVPARQQLREAKKVDSLHMRRTLDECARKSLPPPITRVKSSVHHPEVPLNVSRRYTRYAQEKYDYAVPAANLEYVLKRKGKERPGRNSQAVEQQAVPAGFPSSTPLKRSTALSRPYPRVPVEKKKHSIKQRGTSTLPSRSSNSAAKKADLAVLAESHSCGASPLKSMTYPPRVSRGNVRETAVSPPKSAKDAPHRAESISARYTDLAKKKSRSAYLQRDIKKPGLQPYSGSRGQQRAPTASAQDMPAGLRRLKTVHRATKFEPFSPPPTLEDLVGTTGASYTTPIIATPARYKFPKKRLSSFPGLHISGTDEDPKKGAAPAFSKQDQIVAMQRVAGACVFAVIIATTLFVGYYVSWSIDNSKPSTYKPPLARDANSEKNCSLTVFPVIFGNKNCTKPEVLE